MLTVKIGEIVVLQCLGKIEKSKYTHKKLKENKRVTNLQNGLDWYGFNIKSYLVVE